MLKIPLTEQQTILLRKTMQEKGDDRDLAEVMLEMFRDYARTTLGREYRK
jgi:hypothetical protein